MRNYSSYVGARTGNPSMRRAYREVLLYSMLNYADSQYRNEGVTGFDVNRQEAGADALSFDQKRRYRNEIVKLAIKRANDSGGTKSTYDTDVLIDAFFESSYGQKYADKKSEWTMPVTGSAVDNLLRTVRTSTIEQDLTVPGPKTLVISPYDSYFTDSDRLSREDKIGFIPITVNDDGSVVPLDSNTMKRNARTGDYSITGAFFDSKRNFEGVSDIDSIVNEQYAKRRDTALYNEEYNSGYSIVDRFIKNKTVKRRVRQYMVDVMKNLDRDGRPLGGRETAPEQYEFMEELCGYLDSRGIDFSIDVDQRDNKLVAQFDGMKIRLMDREDPQYRGRIYDRGVPCYIAPIVSVPTAKGSSNAELLARRQADACAYLTNEDCMNMVKWYFGESVPVSVEGYTRAQMTRNNYDAISRSYIGERTPFGPVKNGKQSVSVHKSPARATGNSVLLGVKHLENLQDVTSKDVPFKIMLMPSSVRSGDDLPSDIFSKSIGFSARRMQFSDADRMKPDVYNARVDVALKLPPDKVFSEDIDMEGPVQQGKNPAGQDVEVRLLKSLDAEDEHDRDHIVYYQHLVVREKLNEWVESAKTNYTNMVDIDGIINSFSEDESSEDYIFADDDNISKLQHLYHDVLKGSVSELSFSDLKDIEDDNVISAGDTFEERVAAVRQHYNSYLNKYFGSVPELIREGLNVEDNGSAGFVPEHVVAYVATPDSAGVQSNMSYIKHMLQRLGNDYSDNFIQGNSYQAEDCKNSMIRYEEDKSNPSFYFNEIKLVAGNKKGLNAVDWNTVAKIKGLEDKPVTRRLMAHAAYSLVKYGCDPASVRVAIDKNGILKYDGNIAKADIAEDISNNVTDKAVHITGTIGQITEPGKYGELVVPTRVPATKVLIPGYDTYFVNNDPDNPRPRRDRLRAIGYERRMEDALSENLRKAVFTLTTEYNFTSHNTDLNKVYHHMNMTAHDIDEFNKRIPKDPENPTLNEQLYVDIIRTEAGRCRFPNAYGQNATTSYESMMNNPHSASARDFDYFYGDLCEVNMRRMTEDLDDCFDIQVTGNAINQGIVRYLNEGATVDSITGKITGVKDGQAPLMKNPFMADCKYDPFTRQSMCINATMTATNFTRGAGVALMNVDGWNFDDGCVVSSKFAGNTTIKGEDGEMRPLRVGDKISDKHGNKFTISLIAPENAKDKHESIQRVSKIFNDNPNLDLIASPYSLLSRDNGGTVVEMMRDPENLKLETKGKNGKTKMTDIEGGFGHLDIIVTNMAADKKTTVYDDELHRNEGRGRRASPQWSWAISSRGSMANLVMNEFYGDNNIAFNNMREYAIAVGLDFDPNGCVHKGYTPQSVTEKDVIAKEERNLIKLPNEEYELSTVVRKNKTVYKLDNDDRKRFKEDMLSKLNKMGGFMELPFQLDYKTRSYTRLSNDDQDGDESKEYLLLKTNQTYTVNGREKPTYGMPVLPPELRSGRDLNDGTVRVHDYTNRYIDIYNQALIYIGCEKAMATADEAERAKLQAAMEAAKATAQSKFDMVVSDIVDRKISTKYNIARDTQTKSLANSATSIITADPTLNLDEVAMSWDHAKQLGLVDADGKLKENAMELILRDPCLKAENTAYMKVVIRDDLTGIAVHPAIDVRFDGDFDGDTYGEKVLKNPNAIFAARMTFTIKSSMLDQGICQTMVDKNGVTHDDYHPLYFNWAMDAKANAFNNREIENKYHDLTLEVNEMEQKIGKVIESEEMKLRLDDLKKDSASNAAEIEKIESKLKEYDKDSVSWDTFSVPGADGKRLTGWRAIDSVRSGYMEKVNDLVHEAFTGCGTDVIVVKDNQSVVNSLQKIVDSGAKGSNEKMDSVCANIGIEYQRDSKGKVIADTIKTITDENGDRTSKSLLDGTWREKLIDNEALLALKQDYTSRGGTLTQRGVYAFRNDDIDAMTRLTYPLVQGLLQSKKSAGEGFSKVGIIDTYMMDVFNGYKLTGYDFKKPIDEVSADELNSVKHNKIYNIVDKGNGRTERTEVRCTPEEFEYQLKGLMKAFHTDVNPKHIEKITELLTYEENGQKKVHGLSDYANTQASISDKIMFSGDGLGAMVTAAESSDTNSMFKGMKESAQRIVDAQAKMRAAKNSGNAAEMRDARREECYAYRMLPNSAAFAPMSAIKSCAAYNRQDADAFAPSGRKDVFITPENKSKAYAIMGESQEDYMNRVAAYQASIETVVDAVENPDISDEDKPIANAKILKTAEGRIAVNDSDIEITSPEEIKKVV